MPSLRPFPSSLLRALAALAFGSFLAVLAELPAQSAPPAVAETRAGGPGAIFAVVRLPSHGASATVIDTRPGSSLLLGCAHAFQGSSRTKPLTIDLPCSQPGPVRPARIRLLAVDAGLDLSLIALEDGPLPFVCPVAPPGYRPSSAVLSIGYDGMRWPPQQRTATLLGTNGRTTYTRETPWHGRSGGALLDRQSGYLIGVVQGYEVGGQRRGMYVSHQTVLTFLGRPGPETTPPPRPYLAPPGRELRPWPGLPPGY